MIPIHNQLTIAIMFLLIWISLMSYSSDMFPWGKLTAAFSIAIAIARHLKGIGKIQK